MKIRFHRAFGCRGITIPLPGRWQLEFWYCPHQCFIPSHRHPHIDSRLVFLGGRMLWQREGHHREFSGRHFGRIFRVRPGTRHGAVTTGAFGLFANLEHWLGRNPKTSAATDLVLDL